MDSVAGPAGVNYRDVVCNPSLSAKHEQQAIGLLLMFMLTLDSNPRNRQLGFDKFAGSEFGQRSWPRRGKLQGRSLQSLSLRQTCGNIGYAGYGTSVIDA